MANDVIYPDGVTVSDAEHTALQALNLHPENGVAKTDPTPFVDEARAAQEAVVEDAKADTAPTSAELDARTEAPQSWDGSERRSGSDRRVIDEAYEPERRVAESDRRAEPPAKTEVDTTVTDVPEQPEATSVGEAPQSSVIESPLAISQPEDGAPADANVEGAGLTTPAEPGGPQPGAPAGSETAPADSKLNPPLVADQGAVEPTVPGTPPDIAAHGEKAAEPGGENRQALKPAPEPSPAHDSQA